MLAEVKRRFPDQRRGLSSTEALPFEVDTYLAKLQCFYSLLTVLPNLAAVLSVLA
ncbi:hypothetical protein PPTG_25016 [Phytophthora nicotianae INRA-310]|uniref:Uncharacterized protein n=1 Tax=Phytophthora nicotianae (strain INRA-310) TaxID=761204 RepID=W2PBF5_PHYN3|nr:hypothetical protein PPTG_25016 [Phytophthora nicotianae INRA-310]ETM97304.1 hypothetical protein PPTG_25016 [Phytophthora nicotianae INRA-310]